MTMMGDVVERGQRPDSHREIDLNRVGLSAINNGTSPQLARPHPEWFCEGRKIEALERTRAIRRVICTPFFPASGHPQGVHASRQHSGFLIGSTHRPNGSKTRRVEASNFGAGSACREVLP
jgi:hypothetical protein